MIREATIEDTEVLAKIINESFRNVARRFSLTQDNCPRHPSNCTTSWIESDMARGAQYFLLFQSGDPIGCFGLERPTIDICYLERLSVLPEMRGKHFGINLVQHALRYAASKGARKVSIGIIAEQTELKKWYENQGFVEIQIKSSSHLPFQVCLMEINLRNAADQRLYPDARQPAACR